MGFVRGGNKAIIKPRRNTRLDRGPSDKRISAIMLKALREKGRSRRMCYGRRWSTETAFLTFKRLYGGYSMAKNMETITKELSIKPMVTIFSNFVSPGIFLLTAIVCHVLIKNHMKLRNT